MAHVEAIETNGSVVTRVRGREYRYTPNHKPTRNLMQRMKVATRRRRICVLSHHGAQQLENWNQNQPCFGPGCHHAHYTRDEVEKMVSAGDLRWVGAGENVAAWREPRFLAIRQSGPVTTIQWVTD